jgi:hypothetical protein
VDRKNPELTVFQTVAAALKMLCSDLLIELEKPLSSSSSPLPEASHLLPHSKNSTDARFQKQCQVVKKEYHTFLASTVQFLHEVQERQLLWHWGPHSPVFDAVVWMQGLWASRQAVGFSISSHPPSIASRLAPHQTSIRIWKRGLRSLWRSRWQIGKM